MKRVPLKIRELVEEKAGGCKMWPIAKRVNYKTLKGYARRHDGMSMVDMTAVEKIALAFDVMIEDLVEFWE
ncbi:XRE family transcriptional regulator [Microcoleus sp. Pol12A5]|uniref:XRE family transcriptional regulator n=2 Tax=Microcoleus TaxID=44471 RepID=UPI002FD2CB12